MNNTPVDLSPFAPVLTRTDALHLLRRATFHPSLDMVEALVGKGAPQAVATLMALEPPVSLPSWANDPPALTQQTGPPLWADLQKWWIGHVLTTTSVRDLMVAFWQNHFTSDYIVVYASQWMVAQSMLFRQHAYDYPTLSEQIVGDPAMLRYLDGNQSVKGRPNENFAREWFELFSLGVGNYTEADVLEAARAFTGWRVMGRTAEYNRQLADLGQKTILGQSGPWEYNDVIRITLEQDACARFIATKMIQTFVDYYPSDEAIAAVAALVRTHAYNLRPVLETLLSSNYFYATQHRGALIKSPLQLSVGLASLLNATAVDPASIVQAMIQLTMTPFYPPTVQGWKGHHNWINSSSFPNRQRFGEAFLEGRQMGTGTRLQTTQQTPLEIDLVSVVRRLPQYDDAEAVVAGVCELLLPVETSQEQRDILLDVMMGGLPASYWNIDETTANSRLRQLFQTIVRMPEFQLM
jgi:uncharacterized protein (DUF1800 family)